jgi:hypothetical protein
MANYIVKSCYSETTYVVDFGTNTPLPDEIWSFKSPTPDSPVLCGIVIEESISAPSYDAFTLYDNCCKCYDGNQYTSLEFKICYTEEIIYIDLRTFCNIVGSVPSQGSIYKFLTEPVTCAEFIQPSNLDATFDSIPENKYTSCIECYNVWEVTDCITNEIYYVDFNFATPNPGEIWSVFIDDVLKCVTVIQIIEQTTTNYFNLLDTSCYNCLVNIGYPKSANTESLICVVCSGVTYTISPPHPTWTDTVGKAVVQMNAITLGGPNGLNN